MSARVREQREARKALEARGGYALGALFFVFCFALFFLLFWNSLGSSFELISWLPAFVIAFGATTLVYALFSLMGWAKPLLDFIK